MKGLVRVAGIAVLAATAGAFSPSPIFFAQRPGALIATAPLRLPRCAGASAERRPGTARILSLQCKGRH